LTDTKEVYFTIQGCSLVLSKDNQVVKRIL